MSPSNPHADPTQPVSLATEAQAPLLRLYQALAGVLQAEEALKIAADQLTQALPTDALLLLVVSDRGERLAGLQRQGQETVWLDTEAQQEMLSLALVQTLLSGQTPLMLNDTRRDPDWKPLGPFWQRFRSALGFPLRSRQGVVGLGLIARRPPRAFGASEVALAQSLGEALGNLLLSIREAYRHAERAELSRVLAEGITILTQTLDPQEVVERILVQVERALHVEAALLYLYDAEADDLVLRAAVGKALRSALGRRYPPRVGTLRRILHSDHALWLPDLESQTSTLSEALPVTGFVPRTGFGVPIRVEGQLLGVLLAVNPGRVISIPHVQEMLDALASVAGVTLKHARLFAQLQQAHEEYRTLFNDTLDWIFITNLQGYIVEANKSAKEMIGFTWEDMRSGKIAISRVHTPDPEVVPEDLSTIPSDPPLRYEAEVTLPSGETVPVQVYVRRVTVGGKARLQWILRDISEAKQLETLREDLLSMIYHDLRSPLANIVYGVDVMESLQEEGDGMTSTVLDIIRRAADRIQRLTSTMLDIRRLEAGQPLAKLEPTPPQQLIEDALDAVRPLATSKGQTLHIEVPEQGLPLVMADPEMIRRVLINLLENAVKYTPEEGQIWIGAQQESEKWVRFWVRDNGPGIPLEEQKKLFEKYTRVSTSKGAKGLGLGLAYCRLAIEAHGSTIGVSSRPGAGATFYFTLPVASEDEAPTRPQPTSLAGG